LLFVFLRYSKLGWAVRATAQDRDAAMQMGVDVNRVNQAVFGIAAALGGVSGMLVGMYYNQIDTAMSLQATLKGVVAEVVGGAGNVPGAVIGSLLLGLVESYGVAVFGTSYRNLFAFLLLVVVLVLRPNGLFASARQAPPEPLTGTFIAPSRPVRIPRWALLVAAAAFAILPLFPVSFYVLQTLINAWLLGMLALSLTLVAGTIGQVSLGHAALLAIGAYTSALLSLSFAVPVGLSITGGGLMSAALGTALISPSFRLRGHYVSIATLAIGEIVSLVILNWESVTRGPIGISGIPPLSLFGYDLISPNSIYWFSLVVMIVLALLQARLLGSHLGRSFRAISDDDIAARAYGLSLNRYKSLALHLRRVCRRRQRRHRRASLFLHQPRDLQHAAIHPGADGRDPWRARQRRRRHRRIGGAGRPARTVPDRGGVPHPDLRHRALAAGAVQAAGPVGDDVMAEQHTTMLSLRGLTRRFGGLTAVDAIDLDLARAGSSASSARTAPARRRLFNLVTGLDRPTPARSARRAGHHRPLAGEAGGAGIAPHFQLGRVFGNLSVMDNVLIGAHTRLRRSGRPCR
jgi:ABC-type branched-subunit amino acid transport system permease subunit